MIIDSTRNLRFILTTVIAISVIIFIDHLGFFEGLDNYAYDTSLRMRSTRSASTKIVIAAIDDQTLSKLGRWPLERKHYARLLDNLGSAAIVGFDLIMPEPTNDDPLFAAAIKKQGKVVLPVYISNNTNLVEPLPTFSPFKTGHIHIEPGVDNITRSMFQTLYYQKQPLPSLTSAMFETMTGAPLSHLENPPETTDSRGLERKLLQQDLLKINFYGPPRTFQHIPMADILAGIYPPDFFNGKAVLVGLTAPGIVDEISTPYSQSRNRMAGVEVHANVLNNLLDGSQIKAVADWLRWLVAILTACTFGVISLRLTERNAALLCLSTLSLVLLITFVIFTTFDLWIPPALFFFSFGLASIFGYLCRLNRAAGVLDREYAAVTAYRRKARRRDVEECVLTTGSGSLDELALYIGLKGFDFEVLEPPELAGHLRALGGRCLRPAGGAGQPVVGSRARRPRPSSAR